MLLFLFLVVNIFLAIYSYALVDLNLTLINHPYWVLFRDNITYLGYFTRDISSYIYIFLIIMLFLFHYYFVKNSHNTNLSHILVIVSFVLLLSYPFLSHDLFNYFFDAKIITVYHQNPYLHKALDYPTDDWLRFMHWTHRTYPYGPSWLLLTLVPSLLSFGKFILNFIFFKILFLIFYIVTSKLLSKIDYRLAIFFATSPLVIIEGLINTHNDFIAVCLGLVGIYYLTNNGNLASKLAKKIIHDKNKHKISILLFLLSGTIKYLTLPILFLRDTKYFKHNLIVCMSVVILIVHLSTSSEIQPWYFLNLFIFLPYFPRIIEKLNFFYAGLLLSYYPYIRFGGWAETTNVDLKHQIIMISLFINVLFIALKSRHNKIFDKMKFGF